MQSPPIQSMLDPAGTDAGLIAGLWWYFFIVSTVVFLIVVVLTAWSIAVPAERTTLTEKGRLRWVTGGAITTVVILITIFIASLSVGRATVTGPADALTIEVIGHQWWWEVRYLDPDPYRMVTTANEVHLPAGERVRILLSSRDVIHSFWIPNVAGKVDMFPDRENILWVEASQPGIFRGQCAEYCGMQHAKMALAAVVHTPEDFRAWLDRERAPAVEPVDPVALRGREVFMGSTCATCHRVRGTEAMATFGPELTHIGSRLTLAAGTMPNDRARMAAWLVDPQSIKPGAHMPPTKLDAESLQALLYYLEQLR